MELVYHVILLLVLVSLLCFYIDRDIMGDEWISHDKFLVVLSVGLIRYSCIIASILLVIGVMIR